MQKRILLALMAAVLWLPTEGNGQVPVHKPECAVWDSLYNRYLISMNLDGKIMQIDTAGSQTVFAIWGGYFNSACIGNTVFYQTTNNSVLAFSLASGSNLYEYPISGSVYLGGCTVDTSGNLYVVDIPTFAGGTRDKIFKVRLSDGAWSEFTNTNRGLRYWPRDVIFEARHNRLLVIGAKAPVYIQAVSLVDSSVTNLVKHATDYSNGLAQDQFGNTYATGYDNGTIYRYDSNFTSPPEVVSTGHDGPCNIDYNPRDHVIAVPNYFGDRVDFVRVGRPRLMSETFSDVAGGDGDGIAELGETFDLVIGARNTHFLPLTDFAFKLVAATGGLIVKQGTVSIGTLAARSDITNGSTPLQFEIPAGYPTYENQVDTFSLELSYASDYGAEVDTVAFMSTYRTSCCVGTTGNVDCDPSDGVDISDLSALIDNLYVSFTPLCCPAEANTDGQPGTDISDLSALIDFLYITFTPTAECL